jgi:hypothetical protein
VTTITPRSTVVSADAEAGAGTALERHGDGESISTIVLAILSANTERRANAARLINLLKDYLREYRP